MDDFESEVAITDRTISISGFVQEFADKFKKSLCGFVLGGDMAEGLEPLESFLIEFEVGIEPVEHFDCRHSSQGLTPPPLKDNELHQSEEINLSRALGRSSEGFDRYGDFAKLRGKEFQQPIIVSKDSFVQQYSKSFDFSHVSAL